LKKISHFLTAIKSSNSLESAQERNRSDSCVSHYWSATFFFHRYHHTKQNI